MSRANMGNVLTTLDSARKVGAGRGKLPATVILTSVSLQVYRRRSVSTLVAQSAPTQLGLVAKWRWVHAAARARAFSCYNRHTGAVSPRADLVVAVPDPKHGDVTPALDTTPSRLPCAVGACSDGPQVRRISTPPVHGEAAPSASAMAQQPVARVDRRILSGRWHGIILYVVLHLLLYHLIPAPRLSGKKQRVGTAVYYPILVSMSSIWLYNGVILPYIHSGTQSFRVQ
ncbi:hypothetical protein DFH06DRAFT_1193979 [Mycena polygramma]|nr:hypothetical protein DFH06DRAFT_1193979 [Mycena polygramma]